MTATTWEELGALTVARQFADPGGRDAAAVARALAGFGPVQAQTARSPFIGLAARRPGLSREAVTAAYESFGIVRGSTLRGTVHTCTPGQHRVLDAVTRLGQRALWTRTLRLHTATLEEAWAGIEAFAWADWRTPEELRDHLTGWLRERGEDEAAQRLDNQAGRYFAFGHGGLLRRPLSGGWEQQGAAGYRTARALLPPGPTATGRPGTGTAGGAAEDPVVAAVRLHLTGHGPASRHDLAWWSGLGLRQVDGALAAIEGQPGGPGLVWRAGPDGRAYADLPDAPPPRTERGVRLLPEFDAVLCGYDPKARDRFVTPDHHRVLWQGANGMLLPPLLVDGRVGGFWRVPGSGRQRVLEVVTFPGCRRPTRAELDGSVDALERALGLAVTGRELTTYAG